MVTKTRAQIGMDDNWVKDDELEELLEKRQGLKQFTSDYRKADKEAKEKIAKFEDKMPFRCGRFIISLSKISPRSVKFEVVGGTRIKIKTADEE